jgi:RimJ/RimL family protein N-acetyltransferase
MDVFLETERVVLRRFTEADADNLVALDSDPEVMRYLTGGPPTLRDVIERGILPAYLRYYERGDRYGYWAAIEKANGDFLGWFHFRPGEGSGPGEVELGYRLRRAAWGKGYGTEVSRALIRKGFTELGVERVVASTYEHNVGSRRVMEKAGMALVRTFRLTPVELREMFGIENPNLFDGDEVEYALEKSDWERQQVGEALSQA